MNNIKPKKVLQKRISILRKTEKIMLNSIKKDVKINDICQELGVSRRTLEYIFKDFHKMSPKKYFKMLRLNAFHKVLHKQSPNRLIYRIAEEFCFFHRGHLSSDYKKMFGQLPSDSLKQ